MNQIIKLTISNMDIQKYWKFSTEKYYIYYLNDLSNKLRRKESRLKPVVDRFGNTKNMIDQWTNTDM